MTPSALEADPALRVTVPEPAAEVVGAVLMDLLGPFEVASTDATPAAGGAQPGARLGAPPGSGSATATVTLVFYPPADRRPTDEEVLATLPPDVCAPGEVRLEWSSVSRDWVDGWKQHFRPIVIGEVRVRPPWEPAIAAAPPADPPTPPADDALVDVVINPGLGFGTGLHPTTRGTLSLLQHEPPEARRKARLRGPLVDAGTGSGILAVAAAKLGWGPVFAFDNDPVALTSARENVAANGVKALVEVHRADLTQASAFWFAGATVLANMTLDPVTALLRKIADDAPTIAGMVDEEWPERLVVSGVLAGEQEQQLLTVASETGFVAGERVCEGEWVSLELFPARLDRPSEGDTHQGSW